MLYDVLVVGGGISGLSLAWWLQHAGLSVTLWEQAERTGGKIKTVSAGGYTTEQAASLLMNFRPDVDAFIKKSGLAAHKSPRSDYSEQARYLLNQGQLMAAPTSVHGLLCSDLWSFNGKLRLMAELFIKAGGHEHETVSEFIRRRCGREVLEKAIEPFVAGTLAADPDLANAWSVLPRLTALEQKYGRISLGVLVNKLLRRKTAMVNEVFSFKGGMTTLTEHLSHVLRHNIHKGYALRELRAADRKWLATASTPSGEVTVRARQVVLCTPADCAAKLLQPLDPELSQLLSGIEYAPLSAVHLGFEKSNIRHRLNGTGFLVPRAQGMMMSGNQWMSSLFNDRAPAGKALLTSYLGGARHPDVAFWADQQSVTRVCEELSALLGIKGDPEMIRIDRHERALPLYHGHYYARCRQIKSCLGRHTGLHLEGNYLGGVSIRDRLANSRACADRIIGQVAADQPSRQLAQVNQLVPLQV